MADPLTDFILINHKIFIVCCLILFIYYVGSIILFILKSCGLIYNRQFDKLKDDVFKKVHNIGFNMSNKYNYYLKKFYLKNNYKNIEKNETSVDYLKNLNGKMYYKFFNNTEKVKEYNDKLKNNKTMLEYDNLNEKDYLYFIIWIIAFISPIIVFIAGQIVRIQLCVLFWIFVNWMLIKMLVPIIIIFPIPIFPFIFILPLQIMMLEFIPPFKPLTDLGTLPLLYRLLTRIIDPNVFSNFANNYIKPSIIDIGDYLFYHVRNLGKEYAEQLYGDKPIDNNSKEGEERVKKDNEAISNISGEDEEKGMKKYQEYKENDSVKTTMDKIDQDTQICIGLNQQFKPYGSSYTSEIATDMGNSFNPYSKCYTSAIKSYIKTSIAPPP
jgi:hypothetical protein